MRDENPPTMLKAFLARRKSQRIHDRLANFHTFYFIWTRQLKKSFNIQWKYHSPSPSLLNTLSKVVSCLIFYTFIMNSIYWFEIQSRDDGNKNIVRQAKRRWRKDEKKNNEIKKKESKTKTVRSERLKTKLQWD